MQEIVSLNRGWKFTREDVGLPDTFLEDWKKSWKTVDLLHTWNAVYGMDGNGSYYRGRAGMPAALPPRSSPCQTGGYMWEFLQRASKPQCTSMEKRLSITRAASPAPACKDYSEEYQALYHEHMAKVLDERPWIWFSHVWNNLLRGEIELP